MSSPRSDRRPAAIRRAALRLGGTRASGPAGAVRETLGRSEAATELEVTLRLRQRSTGFPRQLAAVLDGRRPPLSRAELADSFGAHPDELAAVERWALRKHLTVTGADPARRSLEVRGPAAALAKLFAVELVRVRHAGHAWLSHRGAVSVPAELAGLVTGVFGLHLRPLAGRGALPQDREAHRAGAGSGHGPSFTAPQIAALYRFPKSDGHGQTVGVIALGGGYLRSDLERYFHSLRLPHPRFTDVSVYGARNAPQGRTKQFDGEVTGDIETVGGLVPGAHIVVYFAPNTERGFLGAVAHAVHDRRWRPSVISVSWGRNEKHWTRRTLRLFDEVLAEAAALGVTVCCSSGDDGAFAEKGDRRPGVCFPASSAYVVACGGTSLVGTTAAAIRERGWRDAQGASGGGVSALLRRPKWQVAPVMPRKTRQQRGRCMPDVAANGDPASGYRVFVLGGWHVGAGTSAAAPVWAGLVARINQLLGKPLGLFTPWMYRAADGLIKTGALRQVRRIQGSSALERRGWNRHTGLGVPEGRKLAAAIAAGGDAKPG